MWLSRALHRNTIDQVLDPLFVFVEHLVLLRAKPARSKAVDRNPMFAPVVGQAHCQLPHPAATGSIGRQACITEDARHGTNIDDPPLAVLYPAAGHLLRDEEGSTQISVEHPVPI